MMALFTQQLHKLPDSLKVDALEPIDGMAGFRILVSGRSMFLKITFVELMDIQDQVSSIDSIKLPSIVYPHK